MNEAEQAWIEFVRTNEKDGHYTIEGFMAGYQAATERAARICDQQAKQYAVGFGAMVSEECAALIRQEESADG